MDSVIYRNGSLIPSRNEKRVRGVRWSKSWRNLALKTSLLPEEKIFAWKMIQDMLHVGQRMHGRISKNCKKVLENRIICNQEESLLHRLIMCRTVHGSANTLKYIIEEFIGRDVNWKEITTLSFTCRKQSTLKVSIWFIVKGLHMLFRCSHSTSDDLITEILSEIRVNLTNHFIVGSREEMMRLGTILELH